MKKRKEYCCKDGEYMEGEEPYTIAILFGSAVLRTPPYDRRYSLPLTHSPRTQVFRLIHFHFFYGKNFFSYICASVA